MFVYFSFFLFFVGKLSLAEQKELLKQKKEALLRKKAAQNAAAPVKTEPANCEWLFFLCRFYFVFFI